MEYTEFRKAIPSNYQAHLRPNYRRSSVTLSEVTLRICTAENRKCPTILKLRVTVTEVRNSLTLTSIRWS